MQLLDSRIIQPDTLPEPLHSSLRDIVNNITIESNLCICHPDYKPLKLPELAVSHFQKLPENLKNKYLNQQLSNYLYGIYYNNSLKNALANDEEATNLPLQQNLENNTYLGIDLEFYDCLHQSNNGEGYFSANWLVTKEETDGTLTVNQGGLTLYIERDRHLHSKDQTARVGDSVAIKMPKNLVQNGFNMAVGNAGSYRGKDVVRVYFNLSSEGAIAVMDSLTKKLNAISVPFNFKALYNPSDYKRCDSAVLYFDKENYNAVHSVLEIVYREHQSHFQPEVPLFTKFIAPGLALAEEPNHKFSSKDSFGTHRCQIIANALLASKESGDNTPISRMAAIVEQFEQLGLELKRAYLNADSEDIYTPLEI